MHDILLIDNLVIKTIIGVHDWERQLQQPIELDLALQLQENTAAKTDMLADALDYDTLCAELTDFVGALQCQLIETLAEQIAQHILAQDKIKSLQLTLRKPGAVGAARSVGISIKRQRSH